MRHRIANRLVWAISAIVVVAAALVALLQSRAG
jgi:hypothetical protein